MNLTTLIDEIKNALERLLKREPDFTGSLTLQVNFLKGEPGDVINLVEKTRTRLKDN